MIIPENFELHHYNQKAEFLKPCPFCGNIAEIYKIGNDHTKTKKVSIYCIECKYDISRSSLKNHNDAFKYIVELWEKRT